MKLFRLIVVGMALLSLCFTLQAQQSVAGQSISFITEQLFTPSLTDAEVLKNYVQAATFLTLDRVKLKKLYLERPNRFRLQIPTEDGELLELELFRKEILTSDFYLDDEENDVKNYDSGNFYHGYLVSNPKSIAAISIFDDKVYGMISVEGRTLVLGHQNQDRFPAGNDYLLYDESDLLIESSFKCGSDELPAIEESPTHEEEELGMMNTTCKVVEVYFEADYRMFLDNGSSEDETMDFVSAMFNVVALLYDNEGIIVKISKTRVWTTQDSYPSSSSTSALYSFRSKLGGQFDGNIAHLLSTVPANNGGVAYVGVLCAKNYGVAYSNIRNTFKQFPTYSWTVEVVAHEMGHNFGSPHTQSCDWPGGPIDGCVPSEGGCPRGPAPNGGGTIMSYCHLTNYGIDFQKGFGSLPGNLIRSKYQSATCLSTVEGEECENGGGDGGDGGGGGEDFEPNLTRISDNISVNGLTAIPNIIIQNKGQGRSTTCLLAFYVSIDNSFSSSDYFVQSVSIPSLMRGETFGVAAELELNQLDVPPGNYYLGYIIDSENEVEESVESDNIWYWINPRFPLTGNDGGDGGNGGDGGGGNNDDYCQSMGEDVKYEWIARVAIGEIDNESERDGGYGDYTQFSTSLERGSTPSIRLTPGFRSQQYKEQWMVWIDFNKDKDFDDANELVYQSEPSSEQVTGRLAIPGNAPDGKTRMRVSMKWFDEDEAKQGACSSFGYGEVEDYEVEIVGDVTAFCALNSVVPADQTACNLLTTTYDQSIRISYTGEPDTIMATIDGTEYTFEATGSPQHIDLESLVADGNPVDVKITLLSAEGCSASEDFQRLFTAPEPCEATCEVPVPLGTETIGNNRIKVSWDGGQLSEYYQIRYREAGETEWQFQTARETSYEVEEVSENSTYEYQLRANCSDLGWSEWSDTYVFVTSGACGIPALRSVDIVSSTEVQVRWYPLPRANEYRIRYRATSTASWMVRNVSGISINLTELAPGTAYEYQLSAKCGVSWSGWSSIYVFMTPSGLLDDSLSSSSMDNNTIRLYPNPAKDYLTIQLAEATNALVSIQNINGRTIKQFDLHNAHNQIDIADLRRGVYFLSIQQADGTMQTKRFIKQ